MNCFKDHTIFVVHKFNSSGTCLPWVLSFRLISPLMIKKIRKDPIVIFCNRKRVAFQTFFIRQRSQNCVCARAMEKKSFKGTPTMRDFMNRVDVRVQFAPHTLRHHLSNSN
jgi:hypothetical protein